MAGCSRVPVDNSAACGQSGAGPRVGRVLTTLAVENYRSLRGLVLPLGPVTS